MTQKRSVFSRNVWFTVGTVVALAAMFFIYTVVEARIDTANAARYRSVRLADELRFSSEELTRMARSYIATSDPRYRQHYQDVAAIRDGRLPRPADYHDMDWDQTLANSGRTVPEYGPAISLLELIAQAGVTKDEFERLATAKAQSDDLIRKELTAMALVEKAGPSGQVDRAKALTMVFDENYHAAKARVMQPIGEFYAMVQERTRKSVRENEADARLVRYGLLANGLLLLVMLARTRWAMRATLGGPLDQVHVHITNMGQGDFSTPIVVPTRLQTSVLGRLAQTQADLARMDGERRQAQTARIESLRESQTLMEAVNVYSILSMTDPAGTITYANDMFSQVSGYTNAELVGQNHRIVNSGTQPQGYWESVWKTISSGYVWRGEVCNRAKDGSLYWVDTVIAPYFGDKGIERYISIRSDVTANKRAQQVLDVERQRLDNIITGTRAGTWEWNHRTDHALVNARWAELMGYTLEEVQADPNRVWRDAVHPDDLAIAGQNLREHLAGLRDTYEFEGRVRHKNGQWGWQLTRGRLSTRTADGQPEWMYGITLDITETKKGEVERKEQAASLRDNAAFLARAGRVAGIGRWQYDFLQGSIEWSDETCRIHDVVQGYAPSLKESIAFFAPEARAEIQTAIDNAHETGKPWDLELPLVTAMARRVWVRCAAEAEYRDGKSIRLVGISITS